MGTWSNANFKEEKKQKLEIELIEIQLIKLFLMLNYCFIGHSYCVRWSPGGHMIATALYYVAPDSYHHHKHGW